MLSGSHATNPAASSGRARYPDLFMEGRDQLREMVSRRLPLSELDHPFDLVKQGEVKQSVVVCE